MWAGHLVWMEEGDVGRSLGVDEGGPTTKDSRGSDTTRPEEKTTPEMGGLHKEECEKGRCLTSGGRNLPIR